MVSQNTGDSIVCSAVCSGADQRKHQSSASLVFLMGIHRWPMNSPHKEHKCGKGFHLMTSSCLIRLPDMDNIVTDKKMHDLTCIITLKCEHNTRHFADDILKYLFGQDICTFSFKLASSVLWTPLLLWIHVSIYSYHRHYKCYLLPVCFKCLYILPLYILCIYSLCIESRGLANFRC